MDIDGGPSVIDVLAIMSLFTMAGLLANYVLFAGSSEVVDLLPDRSVENGQGPGQPASDG